MFLFFFSLEEIRQFFSFVRAVLIMGEKLMQTGSNIINVYDSLKCPIKLIDAF